MDNQTTVVNRRRLKKSHNGCERCKTRRIKCDEGKPSCLQCTSKKKNCPGYPQPLKWSAKHQRRIIEPPKKNQAIRTVKEGHRSLSQATDKFPPHGNAEKPAGTAVESSNSLSHFPEGAGRAPLNPLDWPSYDSFDQSDIALCNWVGQNIIAFPPQTMSMRQSTQDGSQFPPEQILFNYDSLGWDTVPSRMDIIPQTTAVSENTANLDLTNTEVHVFQSLENFHGIRNTANTSLTKLNEDQLSLSPSTMAHVLPNITDSRDVSLHREIVGEIELSSNHNIVTSKDGPQATQSDAQRYGGSSIPRSPSFNLIDADEGGTADNFDQISPSNKTHCKVVWQPGPTQVKTQPLHIPTFLIEYWFSRVCPIFSTFDCISNPFRVHIDMLWQRSAPVYHSMLSMAAACLNDQLPQMGIIAVQSKTEAAAKLRSGLKLLEFSNDTDLQEDLLMTCYLLGFSTAWHDAQDLGFGYLDAAKALLKRTYANDRLLSTDKQRTKTFFKDGLIYWRMIAGAVGYVDNVPDEPPRSSMARKDASYSLAQSNYLHLPNKTLQCPHPWTGSATTAQDIIARVFILGQQQRNRLRTGDFSKRKDLEQALLDIQTAQGYEEALLELDGRSLEGIIDTGDLRTPKSHFTHLLEAYRVTGLLQTYRSFPDLVLKRLGLTDSDESQLQVESFLRSLAIFVIDQLRNIHPASGTRCIQPILLISVSSELRFLSNTLGVKAGLPSEGYISHDDIETAKARTFILDRLNCFERSLPSKPITTAKSLVREVWDRLDKGQGCHWTEVVMDTKLQSFFG